MTTEYSPSINIIRDQEVDRYYFPTNNSILAFDTIANNFKNGIHSYNIIGNYGSGKSAFLLAFSKHLNQTANYFTPLNGQFNGCKKFQFINIVGNYISILDLFGDTLSVKGNENEILEKIDSLHETCLDRNECLVILIDEFGKPLEFSAKNNPERDLYFIQRLAEYVNSKKRNILFLSTLHQNFDAYSIGMSEKDRKEWEKVKGRIKEIPFNEPIEQLLHLASKVITNKFEFKGKSLSSKLVDNIISNRFFGIHERFVNDISEGLYPLDILAASSLVISLQKYGQNERSLFNFIESEEPNSLKDFVRSNSGLYSVVQVYDYIRLNFSYILNSKYNTDFFGWKTIQDAIDRIETNLNDNVNDYIKIVKTIGLLYVLSGNKGKINREFLLNYGLEVLMIEDVESILNTLENNNIIKLHTYKDSFTIYEGSDIDIEKEIYNKKNQFGSLSNISAELVRYFDRNYVMAKENTYKYGTPRVFKYELTNEPILHDDVDLGNIDGIINIFLENESKDLLSSQSSILYCHLGNTSELRDTVYTIFIVDKVLIENILDDTSRIEIINYKKHLIKELNQMFYSSLFDSGKWTYNNIKKKVKNNKELNQLLSIICNDVYFGTPIFKNELINRNYISGSIHHAKKKYISNLIDNWELPNLGFDNERMPPEKTIYFTLLVKTGIHKEIEGSMSFSPPSDLSFKTLWDASEKFIYDSRASSRKISELITELKSAPFGLKNGFLEFWLITFLFIKREEFALYFDNVYQPVLSKDFLEILLKKPKSISIKAIEVEGVKLKLFNQYRKLVEIDDTNQITNKGFQEIAKPFLIFYKGLSIYAQNCTDFLSSDAVKLRSVLKNAKQLEKTFFEDIPHALGISNMSKNENQKELEMFISKLQMSIRELRTSDDRLKDRFKDKLSELLGTSNIDFNEIRVLFVKRYKTIQEFLLNKTQKSFLKRIASQIPDENAYFNSIAQGVFGKPLIDFMKGDEVELYYKLNTLIIELDNLVDFSKVKIDKNDGKIVKYNIVDSNRQNISKQIILNKKQVNQVDKVKSSILKAFDEIEDKKVIEGTLIQLIKDLYNE